MKRKTIFVAAGLVCLVAPRARAECYQSMWAARFNRCRQAANAWIPAIMAAASCCSISWQLLTSPGERQAFCAKATSWACSCRLIKKLLVISFFYAVLINGQTWIPAIVNSFITIGTNAAGLSAAQNPSDIMAQGIQIVSAIYSTRSNGANLLTQTGAPSQRS